MFIIYDSVLASFLLVLVRSLQQTSWPFFVVSILGVDCPFSELTSVPVCPTLIPLSVGHVSTGSDCQSLTFLPSCLGLFRLDVGSPLVVCTAPVHRAHLCGSRKRESPLLMQEGLALGLTPVCGSPAGVGSVLCAARFVPVCQTRSLSTSGWATVFSCELEKAAELKTWRCISLRWQASKGTRSSR